MRHAGGRPTGARSFACAQEDGVWKFFRDASVGSKAHAGGGRKPCITGRADICMWVCMHVCRYDVLASWRDHHAVLSVCDAWIAMYRLSAGVRRSDNGAPHRPSSFEQHDAQADSQGQVGMAKPLGAMAPGAGFDETDVQRPPGCDVDGMSLDEDWRVSRRPTAWRMSDSWRAACSHPPAMERPCGTTQGQFAMDFIADFSCVLPFSAAMTKDAAFDFFHSSYCSSNEASSSALNSLRTSLNIVDSSSFA
jgi:hypothetical protein